VHIAKRIGGLFLSAVLLWGAPYPFNSAFASGAEQEQKGDSPSLTIYNQQFAVVRQKLPLDLRSGVNHLQVTDITAHLEPDSVILRSLDVGRHLQILEQNYRNDPVSQQLLLSLYEGKAIDFLETDKDGTARTVQGKIIRSGYVPHYTAFQSYGPQYAAQQAAVAQGSEQPVIEVNGKLQFSLPGQPLFPALADDTVLKPTLSWELLTDKPGAITAEFSYVTGGMNWEASYNVIAPPKSNVLELVGWVNPRQSERQNLSRCTPQVDGRRCEQSPAPRVNSDGERGRDNVCWKRWRTIWSAGDRKAFRRISSLHPRAPHHSPRSRNQTGGNGPRRRDPVQGRLRLRRI